MAIQLRIKEIRKAQKKRLEDVAEALGKSRATAHRYEKGTVKPTIDDLAKIARYLNVSINDVWIEVGTENKKTKEGHDALCSHWKPLSELGRPGRSSA